MQASAHLPVPIQVTDASQLVSTGAFDQVVYVRDDDAPVYEAPCECPDCQDHFFTKREQMMECWVYSQQVSRTEAEDIAKGYMDRINQDRCFLQEQCKLYGDLLMSRWRKNGKEKRAKMLMEAHPDLYTHSWFLADFTSRRKDWRKARRYRESFLLPYLNVEDLKTTPALLFGLLHNRTHYPPQSWAPYDSKQLTISWALGCFDVEFCRSCVVMHGVHYGEIRDWSKEEAHRADIVGFPRARLVLEAQATLLGFLRNLVEIILRDASPESQSCQKWDDLTQQGFKKHTGDVVWSPYTHQPYSAPPVFNIEVLLDMTKARLDAVNDHFWLLQTDPTYMRQHVQHIMEHQALKTSARHNANQLLLGELTIELKNLWFWQWTYDEFLNAQKWYMRYRDSIRPGQALPQRFDRALGALELHLVNEMHTRSLHLKAVIPQRPGFFQYWQLDVPGGHADPLGSVDTDITDYFETDPLYWCLKQLLSHPDDQQRFDHAMLFGFLDEHISKSPSNERTRVDENLYHKISEQAAIHELLVAVRLHRPQNTIRDIKKVIAHDDRITWRHRARAIPALLRNPVHLALLFRQFHETPLPSGVKDRNYLHCMDSVRNSLEEFWTEFRNQVLYSLEQGELSASDIRSDLESLSAYNTPAYDALVDDQREAIRIQIEQAEAEALTIELERRNMAMSSSGDPSRMPPRTRRRRLKAVPAIEPAPPLLAIKEQEEEGEKQKEANKECEECQELHDIPEILIRPSRSHLLNILHRMFPSDAKEDRYEAETMVDWDDFVLAMAEAGFAARAVSGLAVVFQRRESVLVDQSSSDDTNGEQQAQQQQKRIWRYTGSQIIFHRPHPVAKIDQVSLRIIGLRMERWFGWHRELFGLQMPKEGVARRDSAVDTSATYPIVNS